MRKLRVGVIGTGGIAVGCHMPGYAALPEFCEIVGVCDANQEVASNAAQKFGVSKVYSDHRSLLADPEIDAVSIATPNVLHHSQSIDALRAGKHVLCEKPLAMNGAEAREMCDVAKETGKILQVALQIRFTGPLRFMKDYIDQGNLGEVYYARAQALRRRGVPSWGVFIDKEKQGGGPLIDIGVHILDATLFLMGYPKPVSASGKTWNMLGVNPALFNNWGDYDRTKFTVEDFAVGMIKFENGAVVVLESSFMGNLEGDPFQTQLFGTKAGAIVKPYGDDPIRIFTESNRQLLNITPANIPKVESSHSEEVKAFVQACLDGTPSPVPGENGLTLNSIFDALYKSSETGKEERVELL